MLLFVMTSNLLISNNMNFLKLLLISSIVGLCTVMNARAQTTPAEKQLSLDNGSINDQFEFVIKKSSNWEEYEVIKKTWVRKLRGNVIDSLNLSKSNLVKARNEVASQLSQIEKLKTDLNTANTSLANVTTEKDSISFFGMQVKKGAYKGIMWGIIAALAGLLLLFVYKFRNSNVVTQEAKQNLNELELEYEEHRRRALEREQKVRRQLQDEINKNKAIAKT